MWGKNISEQDRGRRGPTTAGKRQAGQLAEGHGKGSSMLAKERTCMEAPGDGGASPFSDLFEYSVTPEEGIGVQ